MQTLAAFYGLANPVLAQRLSLSIKVFCIDVLEHQMLRSKSDLRIA